MRLRATQLGYLSAAAIAAGEGGLGVILAPYLAELGFPVALISGFVVFYAIAGLVSRVLGSRFYRARWIKLLIGGSLLLQSLTNLAYPFFVDVVPLAILRLIGGFAFGVCTTVSLAVFIDALPPGGRRERPMAYYTGALSIGFAAGNLSGGLLANAFGFAAGFWGVALYPLLVAIATLFAEEPATIRGARAGGAGPRALLQALADPILLVVLVESFLLNFLFGLHYALYPLYLLGIGASLAEMGFLRGVFSGTQVVSRVASGWLTSSRFGYRPLAIGGLIGQVVSIALLPFTANLLLLLGLSVLYGVARGIMLVANTLGMADSSDRAAVSRGTSSGVYNGASDLGTLLGPLIAGATAGFIGIGNALFVLALAVLVVHVASLALAARWPQPAARATE